jgi:hypothetical protein
MDTVEIVFVIAVLSIILGFIALLSQKVYLDAATKQPTEVAVPLLGKIKTNYPALVFVFLGAALTYGAFQKSYSDKEEWTISGRFTPPSGKTVDAIAVLPSLEFTPGAGMTGTIDAQGHFKIKVHIPKGTSLEKTFETLEYTYSGGNARIELGKEYKMFLNHQESKVSGAAQHERIFNEVPINGYQ